MLQAYRLNFFFRLWASRENIENYDGRYVIKNTNQQRRVGAMGIRQWFTNCKQNKYPVYSTITGWIIVCMASFFLIVPFLSYAQETSVLYKNPSVPISERVDDLLSRMTRDEKIGQLSVLLGWEMYQKTERSVIVSEAFREAVNQRPMGMLWGTFRADPWTKKTLKTGLKPELAARLSNELQKIMVEETRLGIPLLLAEEAPHGHMAIGTTVFPTSIGQASTWNPALIRQMGAAIGKEVRLQGGHIGYGPVLDLAREPRWSRVEETYGEDPFLVGQMGSALVKGFQGNRLNSGFNIASTLKHFVAYGVPEGGHNGGGADVGRRALYENYFPPFKAAVQAGAQSVMSAYNSIDGIPCTAHPFLFEELLRGQWDFNGFVVSDLGSIGGLAHTHHVAEDGPHAAALALKAGVDVDLGGSGYGSNLSEALEQGLVTEAQLDTAVGRVLRLKFQLGLFEDPYVDLQTAKAEVRNADHVALARQVARESITLLKNEDDLLPLDKEIKKIAVLGPNADAQYNQLGDYTAPQPEENITTVLEGIRDRVSARTEVEYVKGCAIRDTTYFNIEKAVDAARSSDVAVVVLGGSSARDFETGFKETGAAKVTESDGEMLSDAESGEGFDRSTLGLPGMQNELLKRVYATGTPVILVLIKGRPLHFKWAASHLPAILDAWYPGQEGGHAVAGVLFGDYNPAGRLPVTVPKFVGQLPVYYNHLKPPHHNYVEMDADPLYSFGYGLSYSSFKYSDLKINVDENKDLPEIRLHFRLKNTGNIDGDEVAQVYVRDETSSVVTPVQQLAAFKRVHLKAGEETYVELRLNPETLMITDYHMSQRLEKGAFKVMVGAASNDIRLQDSLIIKRDYTAKPSNKQ